MTTEICESAARVLARLRWARECGDVEAALVAEARLNRILEGSSGAESVSR